MSTSTEPSVELKACPFCGEALTACTDQADLYVRRYGTHWWHPKGICHLANHEVSPSEITDWNRRSANSDEALQALSALVAAEDAFHMPGGFETAYARNDACDRLSAAWDRARALAAQGEPK